MKISRIAPSGTESRSLSLRFLPPICAERTTKVLSLLSFGICTTDLHEVNRNQSTKSAELNVVTPVSWIANSASTSASVFP